MADNTMLLRLTDRYPNPFWNSGTGLTLRKDDRAGIRWRGDDPIIARALAQGILEPVPGEENDIVIIKTGLPTHGVIKEVFTPSNVEPVKEAIEQLKEAAAPAAKKKRGKSAL